MNSKNSILLVDPEFDPAAATDCTLLIKVTADNYSYAVIDKAKGKLMALYDQQACENPVKDLGDRLMNDSYLSVPFAAVKAAVYTENAIAVPNALFDSANLDQYAKYFTTGQSDQLHIQPAARFGMTSIFTLESAAEDKLKGAFPHCTFFDHFAPGLFLAGSCTGSNLMLDFTAGIFNVNYTNDGKLIFQHSFEISNEEEFNYYLLLMIRQLDMNNKETRVSLSGIIHQDDQRFAVLKKYFDAIEFITPEGAEMNMEILEAMPGHYYTTLLAIDLCE